jgi:hypothetical protein
MAQFLAKSSCTDNSKSTMRDVLEILPHCCSMLHQNKEHVSLSSLRHLDSVVSYALTLLSMITNEVRLMHSVLHSLVHFGMHDHESSPTSKFALVAIHKDKRLWHLLLRPSQILQAEKVQQGPRLEKVAASSVVSGDDVQIQLHLKKLAGSTCLKIAARVDDLAFARSCQLLFDYPHLMPFNGVLFKAPPLFRTASLSQAATMSLPSGMLQYHRVLSLEVQASSEEDLYETRLFNQRWIIDSDRNYFAICYMDEIILHSSKQEETRSPLQLITYLSPIQSRHHHSSVEGFGTFIVSIGSGGEIYNMSQHRFHRNVICDGQLTGVLRKLKDTMSRWGRKLVSCLTCGGKNANNQSYMDSVKPRVKLSRAVKRRCLSTINPLMAAHADNRYIASSESIRLRNAADAVVEAYAKYCDEKDHEKCGREHNDDNESQWSRRGSGIVEVCGWMSDEVMSMAERTGLQASDDCVWSNALQACQQVENCLSSLK